MICTGREEGTLRRYFSECVDQHGESETGEVREVRERDGGEMEMVETNVKQEGESFGNENAERVRTGNGMGGSGETQDITGDNENTRVDNLENVSGHGNVDNEVLEGELGGGNREESEHESNGRSVEIENGTNWKDVEDGNENGTNREDEIQDGRNREEVEDGTNREDVEIEDGRNTEEVEDGTNREEVEDGMNREDVEDEDDHEEVDEDLPYKCKFCSHSLEVYNAYIIHVKSRHPGWQDSDADRYRQERLDSQLAAMIQEQEEQSDTVQVLDENDEVERQLVE